MLSPSDIRTSMQELNDPIVRDQTAAHTALPKVVLTLPPVEPIAIRRSWYTTSKHGFDVLLALLLFFPAFPVLVIAALLVKLTSRGPILYSQIRLGRSGKPFSIYKLRTMYHNCERDGGARWSQPGDPRVTPVGRFLRASHLDELPQLWNILRGDMSIIGPRPERPEFAPHLERAIPFYRSRLLVRPGVTGLAQVQLPPDSDIASVRLKLAHDLYYIRHLSLWLDIRILVCTIFHLSGMPCHRLCRAFLKTAHEPLPSPASATTERCSH